MELVGNHSFTLTSGKNRQSRLLRLKNGVPQGSVLAPLLFNTYISDLPTTVPRKYAFADDLAITVANGDWQAVKGLLSKDKYLRTWELKLSTTKTMSAVFYLNHKEAKRELKVNFNNETLPFWSEPKYPSVTLDKSLMYRWHLESLYKKLTSCVALLMRFSGSGLGNDVANSHLSPSPPRVGEHHETPHFNPDTGTHLPEMALPRAVWVRLNPLHTGVGRFLSCSYKWGMASSMTCECGSEEQIVDRVFLQCLIHGLYGLTVLDNETTERLLITCPEI